MKWEMKKHEFLVLVCMLIIHGSQGSAIEPPPKKLCTDTYLYFNETQTCYVAGEKGPCEGSLMAVESPNNDEFGECTCKIFSHLGLRCQTRPAVLWPGNSRCYFMFDQGPCQDGEWLAIGTRGPPKCEAIPCPDLYHAQTRLNYSSYEEASAVFVFSFQNECYTTGTQGFCPEGQLVVFAAGSNLPSCRKKEDICYNLPFYTHPENAVNECEDGSISDGHGGCQPDHNIA